MSLTMIDMLGSHFELSEVSIVCFFTKILLREERTDAFQDDETLIGTCPGRNLETRTYLTVDEKETVTFRRPLLLPGR